MKLISLNTWCGIKYEELKKFLEQQSRDADVFCFQEVRNGEYINQTENGNERISLFSDIQTVLPSFTGYFMEMVPGVGMASFIRNSVQIEKVESKYILTAGDIAHIKMEDGKSYYPRMLQTIYLKNRDLLIHNFHGIHSQMLIATRKSWGLNVLMTRFSVCSFFVL